MSEYQFYEFQAIDRPLSDKEQGILRGYSGRATITATRFVNRYAYGNFKGDESQWMEKYFDAFLYMANWGTHQLMLRLPASLLRPESANRYCAGDLFSARVAGEHVILDFRSEVEGGDGGWIEDDNDTLSSLLPVRADLVCGDLCALYIAWLGRAQHGAFDDDDEEPPCPPGLRKISAAIDAFANFLRIDYNLIDAAATASPELVAIDDDALRRWVSAVSEGQKTDLLVRLVGGAEAHLRAEVLGRIRESCAFEAPAAKTKARTVGNLLKAAEERRRQQAKRAGRCNATQSQHTTRLR